jgi:hypothetical protein
MQKLLMQLSLRNWIVVRVLLQGLFPVAARRQTELAEYCRKSFADGTNLVVDSRDEYARRRLIVDWIWNGFACHCVSPMVK